MIILIAALAAIVPAGMFLRWAITPCTIALRLGFLTGRAAERHAGHPARYVPAFTVGYRIGRRDRQRAQERGQEHSGAGRPGPS